MRLWKLPVRGCGVCVEGTDLICRPHILSHKGGKLLISMPGGEVVLSERLPWW